MVDNNPQNKTTKFLSKLHSSTTNIIIVAVPFTFLEFLNYIYGSFVPKLISSFDKIRRIFEFELMKTTWYWRQQKKILWISKQEVQWIEPTTGEVRATYGYEDILKLDLCGKRNLKLTFKDLTIDFYTTEYGNVWDILWKSFWQELLIFLILLPYVIDQYWKKKIS